MSPAPSAARVDPPLAADEVATLLGYLDYQRATLRRKVEGLDAEQLGATLPPSSMTLGGMVKHLALVEHWWTTCVFEGQEYVEPWASVDWDADGDWDWHSAADDGPEKVRALFDSEVARSDEIIAAAPSLEELSERTSHRTGEKFTLRWILLHMIEEYARHNGHADLLRESIDGTTGD